MSSIKTVGGYLRASFRNRLLARDTHHYISDMIDHFGPEEVFEGLFGLERQIDDLVTFFHGHNTSLERRLLLLVGPQGAGKSYTVDKIKKHLEIYSQTDEGTLYGVRGCPFHQHPYDLVPHPERPALKKKHEFRWFPEALPCPVCHETIRKAGSWRKVPVERIYISTAAKCGLAKHTPTDLRREDITNFLGNVNFSKLKKIGSTFDPESFDFEGKIIWANRGILDWTEIFKSRRQLLGLLLELIQNKRIDMPNFPTVHVDEIVLGHTNRPEYDLFVNEEIMEPLRGRIHKIEYPYGLEVDNEVQIYRNFVTRTGKLTGKTKHIAGDTLKFVARYAVATRTESHGLAGLSPRFFQDALSLAYTRSGECIDIDTVTDAVMKMFEHASQKDMDSKWMQEAFEQVKEEFVAAMKDRIIDEVIPRRFDEEAQDGYNKFLLAIRRKISGEPLSESETRLVEKVEDILIRREKLSAKGRASFESMLGKRFDDIQNERYDSHKNLTIAMKDLVWENIQDFIRVWRPGACLDTRNRRLSEKLSSVFTQDYGYCDHCYQALLGAVRARL